MATTRFKIVGFWSAPIDPTRVDEFERDYIENHVPIAANLPGAWTTWSTRSDTVQSEHGVGRPWSSSRTERRRVSN